jgi:hypothetical protein
MISTISIHPPGLILRPCSARRIIARNGALLRTTLPHLRGAVAQPPKVSDPSRLSSRKHDVRARNAHLSLHCVGDRAANIARARELLGAVPRVAELRRLLYRKITDVTQAVVKSGGSRASFHAMKGGESQSPASALVGRERAVAVEALHCQRAQQNPPHSITSLARASSVGGTVMPSALAVLRLTTSSNLVGCSIGRSAGLAPCKILCT